MSVGAGPAPADENDARLLANVHPPDWLNPEPAPRYNLVVIGAGTAGLVAAAGAAGLGARVALIERRLMGGDCLNFGCVPSKALIRSARARAACARAGAFGVTDTGATGVDFRAAMERMRRLRAELSANDSARRFRELGVDVFLGEGHFVGRDTIEAAGSRLNFARALIATGARPAAPPIPGLADSGFLTNETVFSLSELPRRIAIIGAGPIGCELAQAMRRLGAQVYLIEALNEILAREDRDAAAIIARTLSNEGVELFTGCKVANVASGAGARILGLETRGSSRQVEVDAIFVGTGRLPNVEGLGLEAAGVEYDEKGGIHVDDYLQTGNPRIFAAGDVCSALQFTHLSDAHARIAIRNALFFGRERVSRLAIPRCIYTEPEIAQVGLNAAEAAARAIAIRTFVQPLDAVDRALLDGETEGFAKVHVREGTDQIVGATIVAAHAGEMISELTLAMTAGIGLARIASAIHPYPTQAEAIKKIADAYNRTRLTPSRKRLLERLLAWRRR
ncbi:MAG TPA: mercuric reductase [Candidatus Binataceae bacterium]|nr:mercuric reductase [Candidatus Binataceae bacterium]